MPRGVRASAPAPAPKLAPKAEPPNQATPAARSGAKVTVACKMPNGMLLRIFEWIERDIPVMGGGVKTVRESRPIGDVVHVRGPAVAVGETSKSLIVGGYALTQNISKDHWDLWLRQNKDSDVVKNKMVFAYESPDHAQGEAAECEGLQSGLQPINPAVITRNERKVSADPRMPSGTKNVGGAMSNQS